MLEQLLDADDKINEVNKRQLCSSKFPRTHSACLNPPRRSKQGISENEKTQLLAKHNALRGHVQPAATNMKKMTWDKEIAMIAQKWASNCRYAHDQNSDRTIPGRFYVGQNLAYSTYPNKDWTGTVQSWYNEVNDFAYGRGSTNGKAIGHYTQVVWATSNLLGCGYAFCPDGGRGFHFYVCNYGPGGNVRDYYDSSKIYKPYKKGTRGADCPNTYNKNSGLCDDDGSDSGSSNNNNNNNGGGNSNNGGGNSNNGGGNGNNGGGNGNNGGNSNNGGSNNNAGSGSNNSGNNNNNNNWNTNEGCKIDGKLVRNGETSTTRQGQWIKKCTCKMVKQSNHTFWSYSCAYTYSYGK